MYLIGYYSFIPCKWLVSITTEVDIHVHNNFVDESNFKKPGMLGNLKLLKFGMKVLHILLKF